MKKNKKIISLLILLLIIVSLIFILKNKEDKKEVSPHDIEQIKKSGQLRIVTSVDSLGFNPLKPGREGFNYEILNNLTSHLELELVITTTNNMDSAIQGVMNEDFDLAAILIPNTTETSSRVKLTKPFFTTRQVLVQQTPIDSLSDTLLTKHVMLANKEIYIPEGSYFKMRIENLSDEIAAPIHIVEVENKTTEALVKEVSDGVIPYTICHEIQAERLKKQFPNINTSLPIGFQQEMCWGINKKSKKFQQVMDDFLSDFLISREYLEIYRKYY